MSTEGYLSIKAELIPMLKSHLVFNTFFVKEEHRNQLSKLSFSYFSRLEISISNIGLFIE